MDDTYYESAEGFKIRRARAIAELRKHGVCSDDEITAFLNAVDYNDEALYDAQDVLRFLGY